MNKKKAIKLATATAIAASAFAATTPVQTQAAVNVDAVVKSAVKKMTDAQNSFVAKATDKKLVDVKTVLANQAAATKEYTAAKATVKKLGGKNTAALTAKLDAAKKTMDYRINNFVNARKEVSALAVENQATKKADAAQLEGQVAKLEAQLAKTEAVVAKVIGASTRDKMTAVAVTPSKATLEKAKAELAVVKVANVKVVNETTVSVKLETAKTGLDAKNFRVLVDGTAVTPSAVVADATGANYTLTVASLKDKAGKVTVNGIEAAYDFATAKVESVSAINSTQVKVVFNKEVSSANPANFTVTRKDDANIRQFVSKVEVNSDNKKEVTVTFADKLTADKAYEVVADGVMAGTEKVENSKSEFYYAKSVPTEISFTSTTIAPSKNIKDIVKVKDQLGRDITNEVEFTIESSDLAIVSGIGATADKGGDHVADKAIVKVTVKGTAVSTSSTIVTVSDAMPASFVGYHIGADETAKTTADYKAKKAEDIVTSVSMGDTSKYLNMYYVDQYGKDIDAKVGSEVTYTNLNPTVAVVGANGQITPISTGTALVKVKVGDLETTVNITVNASATPTTLNVSKTTVNAAIGAIPETFDVSFKDQYGKDVNFDSSKLSIKSADETVAKATTSASGSVSKVTYSVSALKEGTTSFTVTYTDGTTKYEKVIPVTISKAGSLNSYKVEVDYSTLDLNASSTETTSDNTVATISVYSLDSNGNKLAKLNANGDVGVSFVDETATNAVKSKLTLSDTADTLTLNSSVDSATTAKVAVKVGSYVVDTLTFDIKDTTARASKVEFTNNALPSLVSGDALATKVLDLVKLYDQYGKEITNKSDLAIAAGDLIVTNSVNKFAIDGSGNVVLTDADLKKDSTADIVVTKITNDGGTTNLLSSPVVIKAVVKGDTTAPTIAATYPKAGGTQAVGSKKVEVLVKSNEAGKAYFLSVAKGATAPTAVAVVEGANFATLTADTEASQVLTLAADETEYDVYVVVEDAAGNLTAPVKVAVTTPAAS